MLNLYESPGSKSRTNCAHDPSGKWGLVVTEAEYKTASRRELPARLGSGEHHFSNIETDEDKIDPSTLEITDIRFADIDGAPKRCSLLKIYTNQGLIGYGEVRDASSRTYAAMLKSRISRGEPLQCGTHFSEDQNSSAETPRQAGGVCGIEVALLRTSQGKAWGVPALVQLLGGSSVTKFASIVIQDSQGGGRECGLRRPWQAHAPPAMHSAGDRSGH